jgi:hypothetical protein
MNETLKGSSSINNFIGAACATRAVRRSALAKSPVWAH